MSTAPSPTLPRPTARPTASTPAQPAFKEIPFLADDQTVTQVESIAWADVNGDYCLDVAISTADGDPPSQLFLNDCHGLFHASTVLSTKRAEVAAWRTDAQGRPALYLAAFTDDASQPSQYFHFVEPADVTETAERDHIEKAAPIFGAAWADCNEDGLLDLARAHWNHAVDVPDALYVGQPDGRFIDQGEAAGVGGRGRRYDTLTLWADYDNDGHIDLFVPNPSGSRLLKGDGQCHFVDVAAQAGVQNAGSGWSYGGAWGDFDNDGWLDLMIVNHIGPAHLYRNNRDGAFVDVTEQMLGQVGSGYFGATWGDYNGDGWLDLIIAGRDLHPLRLYRNTGENFIDVTEATGLANIHAGRTAWADIDGDSVPDLLICSLDETQSCRLFRNLNVEHANWTEVWLDATLSNPDGYGTKVHVYLAGQDQLRVFGAPVDYAQSNVPLWLGLGQASAADLKVEWPSGLWQTAPQTRAWERTVISEQSQ